MGGGQRHRHHHDEGGYAQDGLVESHVRHADHRAAGRDRERKLTTCTRIGQEREREK